MTVAAATSTAVCVAVLEQVLAPALRTRPKAVLVMDNLAPHKAAAARGALDRAAPGSPIATRRPTRPISTRSSWPGPSSRKGCGRSGQEVSTPSTPPGFQATRTLPGTLAGKGPDFGSSRIRRNSPHRSA